MVAMTHFMVFYEKLLMVVIHRIKSFSTLRKIAGAKVVSFKFLDLFRLADLLPTAVLPVDLSMPTPTRLSNFH